VDERERGRVEDLPSASVPHLMGMDTVDELGAAMTRRHGRRSAGFGQVVLLLMPVSGHLQLTPVLCRPRGDSSASSDLITGRSTCSSVCVAFRRSAPQLAGYIGRRLADTAVYLKKRLLERPHSSACVVVKDYTNARQDLETTEKSCYCRLKSALE
jgi:hypothetical protein